MSTAAAHEHVTADMAPAIAHYGKAGDQHGLCGAPTLGIPVKNPPRSCTECRALWNQMSWWRQRLYRRAARRAELFSLGHPA